MTSISKFADFDVLYLDVHTLNFHHMHEINMARPDTSIQRLEHNEWYLFNWARLFTSAIYYTYVCVIRTETTGRGKKSRIAHSQHTIRFGVKSHNVLQFRCVRMQCIHMYNIIYTYVVQGYYCVGSRPSFEPQYDVRVDIQHYCPFGTNPRTFIIYPIVTGFFSPDQLSSNPVPESHPPTKDPFRCIRLGLSAYQREGNEWGDHQSSFPGEGCVVNAHIIHMPLPLALSLSL